MKRLLKNGTVINVFTDTLDRADVLIEDERIVGLDLYDDADADIVEDMTGKYICPGFIDGHIHIESSMLSPAEFARVSIAHGTTTVIADPHEIANVAGKAGIDYMLEATENLPQNICFTVPSCVPATGFDESGAVLNAEDIAEYYPHPRVLGLAEMMNYPGVIFGDENALRKTAGARDAGMLINGHAPMLAGKELDKYIAEGIFDDHECSSVGEAMEKLRKGQFIMIRSGTAAKNLPDLLPLFDEPYNRRCLLVSDDREAADLIEGHIDSIIAESVRAGKSPLIGIRMATLQTANHFGLGGVGAVAPGYRADLAILDDLNAVHVTDVYSRGRKVVANGSVADFTEPEVSPGAMAAVSSSVHTKELCADDFAIVPKGSRCRVIQAVGGQIYTKCEEAEIDFSARNGIDISRDILKLAVIERHRNTGHIGVGFIRGIGLKRGAIASSVSHDSHNIVVIGTSGAEMAAAANRIRAIGGGMVVIDGGEVVSELPLEIGGLMSRLRADEVSARNRTVRAAAKSLGANEKVEPFMNMSFLCLPVIPELKLTTLGLVDVNRQELAELFV